MEMLGVPRFAVAESAEPAPIWRDAFQSSPAAYEPFSEKLTQLMIEEFNLPPHVVELMQSRRVTGTLRYRIALSAGGTRLRVRLSNEVGFAPLAVAAASVGLAADLFDARAGSLKPLTFGGAAAVVVPAGAPIVSDPVDLVVEAGTALLVSIDVSGPLKVDGRGGAMTAVAAGRQAMQRIFEDATQILSRPLISGVSVETASPLGVVVAFGDSITDGNRLAPDILSGWPERLGKRLAARASDRDYCVINAGIGGNRLLASGWGEAGLGRLDRDVLRIEGVSHLILLEGLNDIGMSGPSPFGDNPAVSPEDLISGYRQVIARARARGIRVIIGTNTPFGDSPLFSPDNEAIRQAVNQWIRISGETDGVIDFEQAIRDPAHPQRLRDEYDSGDHVHPSETGYRAMGDAIDLSLFT